MLIKIFNIIKKKIKELKIRKIRGFDKKHKAYFKIQIRQSFAKINKDASFRYKRIISRLLPFINEGERPHKSVLCTGCRNVFELNEFKRVGFGNVKGIDLISNDKDIIIMDMNNMTFDKDTFDVIYSADSLEHSYNPQLVVNNMLKVLKNGGYICLSTPIQWRKSLHREHEDLSQIADCQDFNSKDEVYALFSGNDYILKYEEMYKSPDGVNNLLAIMQIINKNKL